MFHTSAVNYLYFIPPQNKTPTDKMASRDRQRWPLNLILIGFLVIFFQPSMTSSAGTNPRGFVGRNCIDIAIVGAGIGGSYTAWKLKDRGLKVSVFEYSDRVGGRLFSPPLPVAPGTVLEFGGMRFQQSAHPKFTKTAQDLGLNIVPFPLGHGIPEETLWYVRNRHLRNTDLGTSKVPYNLDPKERTDPSTLLWNIHYDNLNLSSNVYPSIEEMYSLTTKDGTKLYKMSYDNFLNQYASREAYHFLHDTSGWAHSIGPQGALSGLKFSVSYPGNTARSAGLNTIDGGMQKVPETLIRDFKQESSRNKVYMNHQLLGIRKQWSGGYDLWFRKTKSKDGVTKPDKKRRMKRVCARKVILAAQKDCITRINFPTFLYNPYIMKNINSIMDIKAGKMFLAYNSKWWKNNNFDITHTKSDQLTRQTYDWQTGTNNVSIIMTSYHDGGHVNYWREMSQFGTPIPGSLPGLNAVTDVVKNRLEQYLSRIYRVKQEDIPETVGGGMMLWDTYPFKAAWSMFKPGVDEREVRRIVQRPSPSDHVYIVSNSWAPDDLIAWSEGSIAAADEVLNKYFAR